MRMTAIRPLDAYVHDFLHSLPQQAAQDAQTWITRGANFVVLYSQVRAGAVFTRQTQEDEYMVFNLDAQVYVRALGGECLASPDTLVIVPPGPSRLEVQKDGTLVRLFSRRATDLAAQAVNAFQYVHDAPGVAPLIDRPVWSETRLRSYCVNAYRPAQGNMCVFRSHNLMLNIMRPRQAPRDTRMLSPHQHEDFEQGSLALRGVWKHHLRYPWTKNLAEWREDVHLSVGSPSLLVIAPQVIHTSHNVSDGESWLLDIFAPPRKDFCTQAGTVRNAEDYPFDHEPKRTPHPSG